MIKLSLKSLLKYVMVIVILFTVVMVAITLFIPTYMKNFKEGIDEELTIETLTRDIIINMTLEDLYINVFEPFSNSNFTFDILLTKQDKLITKLKELSRNTTNPLTEKDINTLIIEKIIEVPPSENHKKISEVFFKIFKYAQDNPKEMQQLNEKYKNGDEILNNIFESQKTPYQKIVLPFIQICTFKHQPPLKNGDVFNPITYKKIDQFTGLTIPEPVAEPKPASQQSLASSSSAQVTKPQKGQILKKQCKHVKKQQCNQTFNTTKNTNCHYKKKKNSCVESKKY